MKKVPVQKGEMHVPNTSKTTPRVEKVRQVWKDNAMILSNQRLEMVTPKGH